MAVEVSGYTVDFLDELGRGGFGTVYKGYDENKAEVAIKKVSKKDKTKASTEAVKFHYFKDKIIHDQIIQVHSVKSLKDAMWIIMEYCDLGDLNQFFKAHYIILQDMDPKVKLMKQIMNGIVFLHRKDIVHRDIKPGNILLKLMPDRRALVKLGDFGLSKILDPDSITSAMSSNVGTLSFKAPEFWDNNSDDRVQYHRNIDVYAAGLTFAAILQAQPSHQLVPKAECTLQSSELKMPIGFAAFTRMANNQPDINIVIDKPDEGKTTKDVKDLIRRMTDVSPKNRISSSMVQTKLTSMTEVKYIMTTPCFSPRRAFVPNSTVMCFVNDFLVVRGKPFGTRPIEFKLYDAETRNLSEFKAVCKHWLSQGSLTGCRLIADVSSESLVEACSKCKVIRVYDINLRVVTNAYENITVDRICRGPDLGVVASDHDALFLYAAYDGREFQVVEHTSFRPRSWMSQIVAICYAKSYDIVIVLEKYKNDDVRFGIRGISWASRREAWKHCGSLNDIPLDPQDVCCSPQGWIFVANNNKLLQLDAYDGSLVKVITNGVSNMSEVAWNSNGHEFKIAIRDGPTKPTKITCYNVIFSPNEFDIKCPINADQNHS